MMKAQFLLNRIKVDISDDIERVVKYFADHGELIDHTVEDVDIELPEPIVNGQDGSQKQYVLKMSGRVDTPKDKVTVFVFNSEELPHPNDGYITSSCENESLITLRTNQFDDVTKYIWTAIAHELMHAKAKREKHVDVMDSTYDPKQGKYIKYWNNHDPYAVEGNYAEQWKIFNTQEPVLKIGSRGESVKKLQRLLNIKDDGKFGRITEAAVKVFQFKNELKMDGIVGPKTWTLLKKKPIYDLSKWGLSDEMREKTERFLGACREKGYELKITSGYRSQEEQDKLYAQGRTDKTKPIVTWTKRSRHTDRCAIDVAFVGADPYPKGFDWEKVGIIGESIGLRWGGRFKKKDYVHFEL